MSCPLWCQNGGDDLPLWVHDKYIKYNPLYKSIDCRHGLKIIETFIYP